MPPLAWLTSLLLLGETVVAPGRVVRWPSPRAEACLLEGREWAPLAGTCWYPVDLSAPPGSTVRLTRREGGTEEHADVRIGPYPYAVQHLTVPERQVRLSKKDLERVRREEARVAPLWRREGEARFLLPLDSPLARRPTGGRFGTRRFFNGEARSPHGGADYKAARGTPVLAVAGGRVALAEDHFFSGKSVFLDHGGGLISMYFHLGALAVKEGQEVAAGERIGTVGSTGRSTGPHLHLGLRWHGARVDPELLLGPAEAVPKVASSPPAP